MRRCADAFPFLLCGLILSLCRIYGLTYAVLIALHRFTDNPFNLKSHDEVNSCHDFIACGRSVWLVLNKPFSLYFHVATHGYGSPRS